MLNNLIVYMYSSGRILHRFGLYLTIFTGLQHSDKEAHMQHFHGWHKLYNVPLTISLPVGFFCVLQEISDNISKDIF